MSWLKQIKESASRNWLTYGIIVLALIIQLLLVTQTLDFLVSNLLPDDAFYYFEIARHIVVGEGSTFDGINPTNGYHPLWMAVLLPIFALLSNGGVLDTAPIYASLYLSILFNTGTALVLLRILSRLSRRISVRAFALGLFTLNPFILFETLNGLETSLSLLLLASFILYALRIEEGGVRSDHVMLSIFAGLMILARMDLAFYFLTFLIWYLFRRGFRKGLVPVLYMGAGATALCTPWFLWNYMEFGMVLTSASNANTLINHTLVAQDNGSGLLVQLKGAAYLMIYHGKEALMRTGAPWLLFALGGAAAAYIARTEGIIPAFRRSAPVLLVLFSGFLMLFLVNAGIRFTGRAWYFISLAIFFSFAAARILDAVLPKKRQVLLFFILSLLVAGTFVLGWKDTLKDQFANQRAMYEMAGWMNENLPADARIGVFNAGVQGYFARATVINLDALVNNAAYEAMIDRKLWSYIEEENIEYISDFPLYLTYRYKSFLDVKDVLSKLESLHTIPVQGDVRNVGGLTLYQVRSFEE